MNPVIAEGLPEEVAAHPALRRGTAKPWAETLLCVSVALVVVLALVRGWVSWRNDAHVGFADGVNISLAADFRDGIFYRPLFGPDGYGATRYFPLCFVLHGLLMKLGLPVLASGYFLSAFAVGLLLLGTFTLLRGLGVERWLAACAAGALLSEMSVQGSLLSPHPDGLACALNICGLAAVVRARGQGRAMLPAALLFTLAWSTKITAVFGVAAAFVWLVNTGYVRQAWALAAETAIGYLVVVGAMIAGSRGRVLDIFVRANASHLSVRQVMLAPWHVFKMARATDPPLLIFLALAFIALGVTLRAGRLRSDLPALLFLFTLAATAFIFGYRGTVINHCVDAQVAAVMLISSRIATVATPEPRRIGIVALAVALLVAALPTIHFFRHEDLAVAPGRFENTLAYIGNARQPILAENPVIPVLAGQRAYVLDPYSVAMVRQVLPSYGDPLLERIRNHGFSGVVLCILGDPRTSAGRWWYERQGSFGPGFGKALIDNYYLAATFGDQKVWLPKKSTDTVAAGLK